MTRLIRVIYTPGSQSGVPVSMLQSFAAPPLDWEQEAELLRDRIQGIVAGLLGLLGRDADPVKSRESILLANLFEHSWRQGNPIDLASLINAVQNPPIRKMGVMDVDTFFPSGERFELAMALNSIMASPAFRGWLEGQPLDIPGFLATPEGKPRHSIFYIAHLSDAERMFFVTMLLNQLISWMRSQPGTTSLRAILYMDEIFGFFPPVANPPSKSPMLTLLKQARAFGVGVVLATQNPVDLDYKGLTNAGTWFIGRLQTERDKKRVLDGLKGASAAARMEHQDLSGLISELGERVFLMHNVHEDEPVTFQTRWAMSYLCGPLTRSQIKDLTGDRRVDPEVRGSLSDSILSPQESAAATAAVAATPPLLGRGMDHTFLRLTMSSARMEDLAEERLGPHTVKNRKLIYAPCIVGMGTVHFVDRRRDIAERERLALLSESPLGRQGVDWAGSLELGQSPADLSPRPEAEGSFLPVPETVNDLAKLKSLKADLKDYLYRTRKLPLYYSSKLKAYSQPGEAEREFKMRLAHVAREKRDEEVDEIENRYERRLSRLRDRLRRSEITLEKREETASARKRETLVSVGETVLGMFLGRSSRRAASSSLTRYRMSSTAGKSAEEAEQTVRALKGEIDELAAELSEEVAAVENLWEQAREDLEEKSVVPRRTDIDLDFFGLVWVPSWSIHYEDSRGLSGTTSILAVESR